MGKVVSMVPADVPHAQKRSKSVTKSACAELHSSESTRTHGINGSAGTSFSYPLSWSRMRSIRTSAPKEIL
jgi:hypothetical protein